MVSVIERAYMHHSAGGMYQLRELLGPLPRIF
jgi:hypothetical protein